ncbi:alpha/beta-hydrolase family protein [Angustibacter aerolatus]
MNPRPWPRLAAALAGVAAAWPALLPHPVAVQAVSSALAGVLALAVTALVVRRAPRPAHCTRHAVGTLAVLLGGTALVWWRGVQVAHDASMAAPNPLTTLLVTALAVAGCLALAGLGVLVGRGARRLLTHPRRDATSGSPSDLRVNRWAHLGTGRGARRRAVPLLLVPGLALASCAPVVPRADAPARSTTGVEGRRWLGRGLDAQQVAAATGRPATAPARVYVGEHEAPDATSRAALAVARLQAVHALDRSVLVVAVPTGSGWVDPAATAASEVLHDGDVATVAVQYAAEPSWVGYLRGTGDAEGDALALLRAVRTAVDARPVQRRPRVLLFAESLGALATLRATPRGELDRLTDGGLWVGVPSDGRARLAELQRLDRAQVSLRHADDPVAAWSPALAVRPTRDWPQPWVPGLSAWQGLTDLMSAWWTPDGVGHRYTTELVDGWLRVTPATADPTSAPAARAVVAPLGEGVPPSA